MGHYAEQYDRMHAESMIPRQTGPQIIETCAPPVPQTRRALLGGVSDRAIRSTVHDAPVLTRQQQAD